MTGRLGIRNAAALVALAFAVGAVQSPVSARDPDAGVRIGNPSFVRRIVPAGQVERMGEQQYARLTQQASRRGALLPDTSPEVERVRRIARALLPFAAKFNPRARDWQWEVNVYRSPIINAFCMPGGKIAFFTGILDRLRLTDDEVAMIAGHEIAHALREHARERLAKTRLTNFGIAAVAIVLGGTAGELARVGGGLYSLKFSRSDETEADLIGMELAARAGYDPRAGITLWKKMAAANKSAPPQWLSTHPSSVSRIRVIERNMKDVLPLYERAKGRRQ
jgi:Zn-dependent protease with chaperone function